METTTNEVAHYHGESAQSDTLTLRAASIEQMKAQVQDIQSLMDGLMTEGEHYGKIFDSQPKPTLLQPGAEKLCMAFRLSPTYDIEREDIERDELPPGHREYTAVCTLTHIPSGEVFGQGVGLASTMESKYRYRKVDETTDVGIPRAFWDSYDKDAGESMADADFSLLMDALRENGVDVPDGADAGVGKDDDGRWVITFKMQGENSDIADVHNTVLKMATKRALVAAVKTSLATSDIFTQDLEDMPVRTWASKGAAPGRSQRERSQRDSQVGGQPAQQASNSDSGVDAKLEQIRQRLDDAEHWKIPSMIRMLDEYAHSRWSPALATRYAQEVRSLYESDDAWKVVLESIESEAEAAAVEAEYGDVERYQELCNHVGQWPEARRDDGLEVLQRHAEDDWGLNVRQHVIFAAAPDFG